MNSVDYKVNADLEQLLNALVAPDEHIWVVSGATNSYACRDITPLIMAPETSHIRPTTSGRKGLEFLLQGAMTTARLLPIYELTPLRTG